MKGRSTNATNYQQLSPDASLPLPTSMPRRRGRSILLILFIAACLTALSHIHIHIQSNAPSSPHQAFSLHASISHIRPQDRTPHSRTLGVADAIFVISLLRSPERRVVMDTLAEALEIDLEYVDATDYRTQEEVVKRLMDRVRWQRPRLDDHEFTPGEEEGHDVTEDGFPFKWSAEATAPPDLSKPIGISGADYWDLSPPDEDWEAAHPMPPIDPKWADTEEGTIYSGGKARNALSKPIVATFHSHVRVLREVVRRNLSAAIILEDDVDIDFSIERTLALSFSALPQDWDMVYLGYCYSAFEPASPFIISPLANSPQSQNQLISGPHSSPLLHISAFPLCTHAYTVSRLGAQKLLRFLRSPDFAFSRPIDHAYKDLIQMGLIKSYTLVPPVVVQTKKTASEVNLEGGGRNEGWKECLVDSTLERVEMFRMEF